MTVPRPPPPVPAQPPPPRPDPAAAVPSPTQPTAAQPGKHPAAPEQISDAASGKGYGRSPKPPADPISDAALGGGYGTRYYTYLAEAERVVKKGQKIGFTKGRGYYVYTPPSQKPSIGKPGSPHAPRLPPGTRGISSPALFGGALPSLANIVHPFGPNRIPTSAKPPMGGLIKTAFGDDTITYFAPAPGGAVKVEITAESSITFSGGETNLAPAVTLNKTGHVSISDAGVTLSDQGLYFLAQQLGSNTATVLGALYQGSIREPTGIALTAKVDGTHYAIPLKSVTFSAEVIKKNGLPVLVETTTAEITLPTPKGDITISYSIRSEFTPLPTPPHSTPIPVKVPPVLLTVAIAAAAAYAAYLYGDRSPRVRPT